MKSKLIVFSNRFLSIVTGALVAALTSVMGFFDFMGMNYRIYPLAFVGLFIAGALSFVAGKKTVWMIVLAISCILLLMINIKLVYPDRPLF